MREANQLVGKTLGEVAKHIVPGVSTLQLDKIAEEFIRDNGAVPAFLGYGGFPNSICASVNDQVVHGIPSSKMILKEGDVISVDCGTILNGFVGDSAYTSSISVLTSFCIAFEKNFPLASCFFRKPISFGMSSSSIVAPRTDSTAPPT